MRIGRIIPPAASPLSINDIVGGLRGLLSPEKTNKQLHESFSEHFHTKHCFFVSSGKAAISLSLMALSHIYPSRTKVIIPAFNCFSVPSAIIHAGFSVLPCDIDINTLQLNLHELVRILETHKDILAIIPAHLFGLPAPMEKIKRLVKKYDIPIIEDAAQAMGSFLNMSFADSFSDIIIFSLSRGKSFTAGEGGIVVTSSDDLGIILNQYLKSIPEYTMFNIIKMILTSMGLYFFIKPELYWFPELMPFLKLGQTIYNPVFPVLKFNSFQAGITNNWRQKVKIFNMERIQRLQLYTKYLSDIKGIFLVTGQYPPSVPCIRFPVIVSDSLLADKILSIGSRLGLGISKTYPHSIDVIPALNLNDTQNCKNALYISKHLLTLPCHPLVNFSDVLNISNVIRSVIGSDVSQVNF